MSLADYYSRGNAKSLAYLVTSIVAAILILGGFYEVSISNTLLGGAMVLLGVALVFTLFVFWWGTRRRSSFLAFPSRA